MSSKKIPSSYVSFYMNFMPELVTDNTIMLIFFLLSYFMKIEKNFRIKYPLIVLRIHFGNTLSDCLPCGKGYSFFISHDLQKADLIPPFYAWWRLMWTNRVEYESHRCYGPVTLFKNLHLNTCTTWAMLPKDLLRRLKKCWDTGWTGIHFV